MFVAAVAVIVHFRAAKIFARAYAAFLALVLNHVGKYIAHLLWLFYALYVHFGAERSAVQRCIVPRPSILWPRGLCSVMSIIL